MHTRLSKNNILRALSAKRHRERRAARDVERRSAGPQQRPGYISLTDPRFRFTRSDKEGQRADVFAGEIQMRGDAPNFTLPEYTAQYLPNEDELELQRQQEFEDDEQPSGPSYPPYQPPMRDVSDLIPATGFYPLVEEVALTAAQRNQATKMGRAKKLVEAQAFFDPPANEGMVHIGGPAPFTQAERVQNASKRNQRSLNKELRNAEQRRRQVEVRGRGYVRGGLRIPVNGRVAHRRYFPIC